MYEKRKSGVQASLDFLFYARRTSNSHHERYSYSLLGPGTLTAHRRFHLVLLHSCPDTVHGVLLRKTQTSTPLIKGSSTRYKPQIGITPAVADCRYRAPLSPQLVRPCFPPKPEQDWHIFYYTSLKLATYFFGGGRKNFSWGMVFHK